MVPRDLSDSPGGSEGRPAETISWWRDGWEVAFEMVDRLRRVGKISSGKAVSLECPNMKSKMTFSTGPHV
ncbi:hypothetical protein TNCT_658151 [Trichonephila clavata]|uniref:Uncharacterized protein n=1 Tax=Trichonephila clavata TaxID=2740835 RepID=A0A8X6M2R6_TRICU|nr:hypothetical protein TNCT_658151 [Trichonephila clavata]